MFVQTLCQRFGFQEKRAKFELDVKALDLCFNLASASTQFMNMKVPWRGVREIIINRCKF